ncbi:MAG TPA: DUF5946 family protein [Propionibacteriaceae bacterium]|jgi:hypothetical protein
MRYVLSSSAEPKLASVAVDTYAAQYPGPPAKRVTLWFALAGLHLALEEGWTGRQVQVAHQRLSRLDKVGPGLGHLVVQSGMTVGDVMAACPGDERDTALTSWARAVWHAWSPSHGVIAAGLPPLSRLRQ